jgi:hypothetical protein
MPPPPEGVEVGQLCFRMYNELVYDDDTNLLVKKNTLQAKTRKLFSCYEGDWNESKF